MPSAMSKTLPWPMLRLKALLLFSVIGVLMTIYVYTVWLHQGSSSSQLMPDKLEFAPNDAFEAKAFAVVGSKSVVGTVKQQQVWAEVAPQCPFYDDQNGLFHPDTPHPRYIVTGGAGFIGSNLVVHLSRTLQPGQVKVIDNLGAGTIRNLRGDDGSWAVRAAHDVCHGDLRDARLAQKLLRGADTVYHLAAATSRRSASVAHDNVLINTNTVSAAKANGVRNFIYVGTAWTGPEHPDPTGDRSEPWSKGVGEYEAELARDDRFRVGLVRLRHVYGRRADLHPDSTQLIPSLVRQAINSTDGRLVVSGARHQYGDFVHVDDVVAALVLVEQNGMNKGPIEIGSGRATTLGHLAQTVADAARTALRNDLQVVFEASSSSLNDDVAVLDQAQALLGWRPIVTLTDGITDLVVWMGAALRTPRVLVVEIGNQRGSEYAWKSMHKHLLRPYRADLALFVTDGTAPTLLQALAQYVWTIPDYDDDWSPVFNEAAARCRSPDQLYAWHRLCQCKAAFLGLLKPCTHPTSSGLLWSYRWLTQQRLLALNLLDQYDYIVMTRTDELYVCDHHPFQGMAPEVGYLPEGEHYGGWSDRHLIATPPMFMRMINMTNEFVCDTDRTLAVLGTEFDYNIERVQAVLWAQSNLTIAEFPRSMFTVRAPNDPTRWSGGNPDPILSEFQLKIKYENELALTKAHCGFDAVQIADIVRDLKDYDPWKL